MLYKVNNRKSPPLFLIIRCRQIVNIISVSRLFQMKGFKPITKLGEGAFGVVYKVLRTEDNKEYALKQINMKKLSEKEQNAALNQIRILASITHPNIIGYRDAFFSDDGQTLNIVMDFASKGDLNQKIQTHKKNKSHFTQQEIWKILIHVCRGLRCLHSKSIVHRDLKGANIFINADDQYLLGDLNIAKVIICKMAETQIGTPYYASPEVWQDIPYDQKSDMWSLGCILYEMAALDQPFKGKDMPALARKIKSGIYSRIPDIYSKDLTVIIGSLLKVSPHLRLSSYEVLQHQLVKKNYPSFLPYDSVKNLGMMLNTINFNEENPQLVQLPKPKYEPLQQKIDYFQKKRMSTLQSQRLSPKENRFIEKQIGQYRHQKSLSRQYKYKGGDLTDRNDKYKKQISKIKQSKIPLNVPKAPPRPNISNKNQRMERSPSYIAVSPRNREVQRQMNHEILYNQYLCSRERERRNSYGSPNARKYIISRKSLSRNY